jgi:hypothetical protein
MYPDQNSIEVVEVNRPPNPANAPWMDESQPFIYHPDDNRVYLGNPGTHHPDIMEALGLQNPFSHDHLMGRTGGPSGLDEPFIYRAKSHDDDAMQQVLKAVRNHLGMPESELEDFHFGSERNSLLQQSPIAEQQGQNYDFDANVSERSALTSDIAPTDAKGGVEIDGRVFVANTDSASDTSVATDPLPQASLPTPRVDLSSMTGGTEASVLPEHADDQRDQEDQRDADRSDEEHGHRLADAPIEPPNYRHGSDKQHCGNCKMFNNGKCWGYGNKEVEYEGVCDSWSASGKTSASHIMYHVTPSGNRDRIREQGLDPAAERLNPSAGHEPGVYVWDTPEAAMKYRGQGPNAYRDMDIHAVDVSGLPMQRDQWLFEHRPDRADDFPGGWFVNQRIEPSRIYPHFIDPWNPDKPNIDPSAMHFGNALPLHQPDDWEWTQQADDPLDSHAFPIQAIKGEDWSDVTHAYEEWCLRHPDDPQAQRYLMTQPSSRFAATEEQTPPGLIPRGDEVSYWKGLRGPDDKLWTWKTDETGYPHHSDAFGDSDSIYRDWLGAYWGDHGEQDAQWPEEFAPSAAYRFGKASDYKFVDHGIILPYGWETYDGDRRPFIYDRHENAIHIGPLGALHGDLAEMAEIPYANSGSLYYDSENNPSMVEHYGAPFMDDVEDAVRERFGLPLRGADYTFGKASASQVYYHVAPSAQRMSIAERGLVVGEDSMWSEMEGQPQGVYLFSTLDHARQWIEHIHNQMSDWDETGPLDIWAVQPEHTAIDPMMPDSVYSEAPIPPTQVQLLQPHQSKIAAEHAQIGQTHAYSQLGRTYAHSLSPIPPRPPFPRAYNAQYAHGNQHYKHTANNQADISPQLIHTTDLFNTLSALASTPDPYTSDGYAWASDGTVSNTVRVEKPEVFDFDFS